MRIALLTDFGTVDPYVAVMKGVLASHTDAAIHDLTHEIPPFDVFCSMETDPTALPRPDSGSATARFDPAPVGPGDRPWPRLATMRPLNRISCAAVER